jgi:hypothetical protein
MNTKVLKGLLMTLVGVAVVSLNETPVIWSVMIVTMLGTALVYVGKNAIVELHSISPEGELDWQNVISSLLIAVGTAVVSGAASLAGTGVIDWILLLKTVGGVSASYLGSTLFTGKPIEK